MTDIQKWNIFLVKKNGSLNRFPTEEFVGSKEDAEHFMRKLQKIYKNSKFKLLTFVEV